MGDYDNVELSQPSTAPPPSSGGCRRFFTIAWVRTPLGLLKLAETVVCLLALIIASVLPPYIDSGSIEFFKFVNSTALISALITLILYVTNIFAKLPDRMISNVVFAAFTGTAVIMELLCCSIMMSKFRFDDTALAAGSFGLIAMFIFLFEFAYYFINLRKHGMWAVDSHPISGASTMAPAPTELSPAPGY